MSCKPVPDQWTRRTLRELATINYGRDPSSILDADGPYPVYGTSGSERLGTAFLYDGESIILGRKGTIDRVHYATRRFWTIDTAYFLSKFNDAIPKWLYYFLASIDLRSLNEATGVPSLSRDLLYKIVVPTPPGTEQSKIAEILSKMDRAIEQTEALIAKQQRIKIGLMQDLLTRGIDEHGNLRSEETHEFKDSRRGRIPEEWKVSLLDSMALRGSGHTPNKLRPEYWNGGIKWVSLADSRRLDNLLIQETDKEISDLGLKNSSAVLHPKGTVILSRDAGVGKSAILGDDMAVSQHFMAWRCKPKKLDNVYLYYWLQRDKPKFEGIASGSTIVTIGLQFFRGYEIAAPTSVAEQRRISELLSVADRAINQSQLQHGKLSRLRTALMQDLLTGRHRMAAPVTGLEEAST
jgi:type I restriction enzyme S subunit